MKTDIILKKTRQRVSTHAETARLLIEMGRAVTVEDFLAAKASAQILTQANAIWPTADTNPGSKADAEAEARQTKVIEPAKTKTRRAKK